MPKENTHIYFAHGLIEHMHEEEIIRLIKGHIHAYYLGSVIPDTFYYSPKASLEIVSETLHGRHGNTTNDIIFKVLEHLQGDQDTAFILGYITHCALDMTFHPLVYYLSGNYYSEPPAANDRAVYMHRRIETYIDSRLDNTLRIYDIVKPAHIRGLIFEKIISDDFSLPIKEIYNTLWYQLCSNRIFASRAAYRIFKLSHRVNILKGISQLGLFYSDVRHGIKPLPDGHIAYRDIITGQDRHTTINGLFDAARTRALPMIKAAFDYSRGLISRQSLTKAIPGESLNTGMLNTPVSSIRYTLDQ